MNIDLAEETLLIEQIRGGETELFDRLDVRHRHDIFVVCLSVLGNSADAEDAVQAALVKAFQRLDQLRSGQCFRRWLLRIALNEAREYRRNNSKWRLESIDDTVSDEGGEFTRLEFGDSRHTPAAELEQEQTRRIIECALNSLPETYREILLLREVEQLDMAEVSSRLGISLAAATSRLHRARLDMRERVAPFFLGTNSALDFFPHGVRYGQADALPRHHLQECGSRVVTLHRRANRSETAHGSRPASAHVPALRRAL